MGHDPGDVENRMNRLAILGVALAISLGGCNTVSGIGDDLQVLGGAMSDAASDVQSGGAAAGEAQAAACAPDAHGRPQSTDCGPPPLNSPSSQTAPQ